MTNKITNNDAARFEELLTPYIQGRLDADTEREVEHYANTTPEFAELLKLERQVAASIKAPADAVVHMPNFQVLRDRIAADESAPVLSSTHWQQRLSAALRAPAPWLIAASVAAAAIVFFVVPGGLSDSSGGYETLSSGDAVVASNADHDYFRMVPSGDRPEEILEALRNELGFTVESGPDSIGSYIVSVPAGKLKSERIATWREDKRLMLVEAVTAARE